MSLAWTPEQKQLAKDGKKALVKLQVQLKHAGGGNYSIVGPFGTDRALGLYLLALLRDDDPRIEQILAILKPGEEKAEGSSTGQ